jgi:outer membrane receptor protein involved in Fe transport
VNDRRTACACALVLLAAGSAHAAQAGLLVDDRTGLPIAGARITVVGHLGGARSDANGRFELDVPRPPFVVVVILADGRVARPIDVRDDGELLLRAEPAVSEAVTVSGVAPGVDRAPGAAATYLSGSDVALRHPATLVQALDGVPGAHFVSEGQAAAPSLRGLARGRTLILVDGTRASAERRAGPNASFLDPATVAGIDVVRGFGSVAYGSDAFGGVIAIRTRRPDHARVFGVRFTGTLGAGWMGQRGELELSSGYGSGGVSLAVRARELDDYDSPDALVPNSGWRDQGVRLAWDHESSHGQWFLSWQTDVGRELGRPRSDGDVLRLTSPREHSHRLTVSYAAGRLGPFRQVALDALVGASRQVTEQDRFATPMRPRSVERNDVSYGDAQLRVTGERLAGRSRLQAGLDLQSRFGLEASDAVDSFNRDDISTGTVVNTSVESASRRSVGLFGQADHPLTDRLIVSGGLRGEAVTSRNRGGFFGDRSVSNGAGAGFGAVSLTVAPGVAVTAQIARGFREPTLSDRFARGPVGRGFLEGNPDLGPETSVQLDVGLRMATGRARAAVSTYVYRINDLIERYTAGPDLFRFRNRPRARLTGVELEAQATAGRFVVEGAASLARGRDADDGTPLDDVPPATLAATIRHATPDRWTSYVRLARVAGHDEAGPGEVPTPGYVMLDGGVSLRLSRALTVRAVARNLLNERHYASAGPRWVYAPGRYASVTVIVGY